MKIMLKDSQGEVIFENLAQHCSDCESKCNTDARVMKCCVFPDEERRIGKVSNDKGVFFLCGNRSIAKTSNLFKEKLHILVNTTPTIQEVYKQVQAKGQERYEIIVHNLRSLNGQSIQEQYNLIPQDLLVKNYQNQIEFVTKEIAQNAQKAAFVFLRLIKNNMDIKTEFAAYEKLSVENPVLSKNRHEIRKVILNVYHAFSLEFHTKKIFLTVEDSEKKLVFDYDTIRIALYHIFGNASKYMKPNSKLMVSFCENKDSFSMIFEMDSIHIMKDEVEKIFEDNYSGQKVVDKKKEGKGLGMGLVRKALALNEASITVEAGEEIEKKNKIEYSRNKFIISFKTK